MPGKIIPKSAEFIESSESESESRRRSAPQTSNQKRKHTSQTSISQKRAKTTQVSFAESATSESEDDSQSESEDDSHSESENQSDEDEGGPHRTVNTTSSSNHVQLSAPTIRTSPPPYQAPDGFERSATKSEYNVQLDRLFTPSNLAGKQIWSITAPTGIPLSNITELAQAHVKNGDRILSFQGNDYRFVSGNFGGSIDTKLLVPTNDGTAYRTVQDNFAENLHLRQMIQTRNYSSRDSQAAALFSLPLRNESPQQPSGLKTRWWPAGFEKHSSEHAHESPFHDSEEEEEEESES